MSDNPVNNSIPKGIGVVKANAAGKLFNNAINVMGKSLNLRLARHSLTSSNLANQNTPGYRVRDIKFEKIMSEALDSQDGKLDMDYRDRNHMPSRDLDFAYMAAQKNIQLSVYGQDAQGPGCDRHIRPGNEQTGQEQSDIQRHRADAGQGI